MSELAKLFPAAYQPHVASKVGNASPSDPHLARKSFRGPHTPLSTRHRMILTLELRGMDKTEIAKILNMNPQSVVSACRTEKYIAARDALLAEMDQEFINMKPDAMAALRRGLNATETAVALHASETWMKAAGFMQYGKDAGHRGVTAEDVAAQLLQVNININTGGKDG
jgi:RNA 3'-terminal phosphate cyclase